MKQILILWDASHIWGLMALHAMRSLGLPCRLTSAKEIAQGDILGKQAALLLVPGGSARRKAYALGSAGLEKIRQWLVHGGAYLGFCGGAGLALTQANPAEGLGICPWRRYPYSRRFLHLLSGHLLARLTSTNTLAPLPVWWPGRFAPAAECGLDILAEYVAPGEDLWLSDLPLAGNSFFWGRHKPELELPQGQPLVVYGKYGNGAYILSYAHLETPASPAANEILCELVEGLCGLKASASHVPAWITMREDPNCENGCDSFWRRNYLALVRLLALGRQLGLFFTRSSWLLGWRHGIAGMPLNSLLAAYAVLQDASPQAAASRKFFMDVLNDNEIALKAFCTRAEKYFRKFSLVKLCGCQNENPSSLELEGALLFGQPMLGGGMAEKLLYGMENIIYGCQDQIRFIA